MKFDQIIAFCDGACSGNPGPGGWGVALVTPDGEVRELGGSAASTTNNQMELTATIRAIDLSCQFPGDLIIYTDSTYVIRGITQWIWGWMKRGWQNAEGGEVSNQELWKQLSYSVQKRKKLGQLNWKYVRGHTGVPGNERVDEIAVCFSKGQYVPLYSGSLLKYDVAILDLPEDQELPEMKSKEPKPKALGYISVIGGVVAHHETWVECERRVKGQSGAKFKKFTSKEEEIQILKDWGLTQK